MAKTANRTTRAPKAGEGSEEGSRANGEGDRGVMTGTSELQDLERRGVEVRAAARARPTDTGDREVVNRAELDKVYTFDSKEKWDDGQPSLQDQLKAVRETEEAIAKKREE